MRQKDRRHDHATDAWRYALIPQARQARTRRGWWWAYWLETRRRARNVWLALMGASFEED